MILFFILIFTILIIYNENSAFVKFLSLLPNFNEHLSNMILDYIPKYEDNE